MCRLGGAIKRGRVPEVKPFCRSGCVAVAANHLRGAGEGWGAGAGDASAGQEG